MGVDEDPLRRLLGSLLAATAAYLDTPREIGEHPIDRVHVATVCVSGVPLEKQLNVDLLLSCLRHTHIIG